MNQKPTIVVCVAACLIAGAWVVWMLARTAHELEHSTLGESQIRAIEEQRRALEVPPKPKSAKSEAEIVAIVSEAARSKITDKLIERLLRRMLANQRAAIEGEAVLSFATEEDFKRFVSTIKTRKSSVELLGMLEQLRAIRVGYAELEDLRDLLGDFEDEVIEIDANYVVTLPIYPIPDPDAPLPGASGGAPFRNTALRFLGVSPGENAGWGSGVVVAVIDSGVAEHPTFREGQVRIVGDATAPPVTEAGENSIADGHGTAVASIIAGSDSRTPGVAPQAQILSFQLLDADGNGDSFTLAAMIAEAVTLGAEVINLSIGSFGDSQLVHQMVDHAADNQRLVVASTGNDGGEIVVYPAAYESVVAVGAIDAQGEHLAFSNSGDELDLAAPGLAIDAAWPNDQMVEFSGTSASAPFVSGAIAAVMSENPEMNAIQAWHLLQQFTDEAGAPGIDPQVGRGNLNIGRLMERDERGIFDIALSSHHYDPESLADEIQVTVQNRGTEPLLNIDLEVNSSGRVNEFFIPLMHPGEIATRRVGIDQARRIADGQITVGSIATISSATPDRTPANNLLQSVISFTKPETAAK